MIEKRINALIQSFPDHNIDSLLITSKANVYYFSNYYTDPHERLVAIYVSKQHDPILIVPAMEVEDAKSAGWNLDIIHYGDHENVWELFFQYVEQKNALPQAIGLEYNQLTLERFKMIQQLFPNSSTKDAQDLLAQLRVIKTEQEYTLLKESARLADYGIELGMKTINEGATELDIIAEIEYGLKKAGVKEMSFSTMVLSGHKTSSPHGTPSTDKIRSGNLILFDLGVVHEGYCSDITRTFAYQQLTDEQENIYNIVRTAEESAIQAAQVGTEVGQLDQTARHIITEAGYGEYFTHRIGHGLGIDVHEYPSMHQDNPLALQPGMCFTIEPGIYVPKIGGVRIEDMIFTTSEGPEILTEFPKQLHIIE